MIESWLGEATLAMADVGDKRAFLVTSVKFPEGGQRVEQIQQIVDCMQAEVSVRSSPTTHSGMRR